MLFIFGGLPGTGKSTLSMHLAQTIGGVHLRIDTIEHAMRDGGLTVTGPEGYIVAYQLANDNLRLGLPVIADSVNPLEITRKAWREVAIEASAPFCEIEVVCADEVEHRRRVETRQAQNPGLTLPAWKDVVAREYERWESEHIVIDTARQTLEGSKEAIERIVELYRAE